MSGGFGNTPWGSHWGAGPESNEIEHIPASPQWDTFDLSGVRQPNDMERVQTFVEVSTAGDGGSFFIASFNIASGGAYPALTAVLLVDIAVSNTFTVQYQVRFNNLPSDFSGIAEGTPAGNHAYLGVWSQQDYAAGFFLSQQGWAYTGEVSLDSGGNVVPAQPVNVIPGSDAWTQEGKEYNIRIVVDSEKQLLYLYISEVGTTGLALKALLVAIHTVSAVSDNAFISAKGSSISPTWIELFNYQLSSKALFPSLPPIADAGSDQAILRCAILQLDGRRSFDPAGGALTYEWRMVDAPATSMFCISGGDGQTQTETPPTGFTYSFFSPELQAADALEPVQVNDVLTYSAGSFTIKNVVRTPVFKVVVEYEQLPESRGSIPFKVIRQAGINGATDARPTFYPDVLGFYAFDLRVSNETSSSSPLGTDRSRVLINVLESPLPRGCEVQTSFMFDYLLSFWKQVEDRDRIATFWEALARTASTELFTLWQLEYSKSLRDTQRTFIRRWIHYDTLLPEPSPELTRLRYVWGGISSDPILGGGVAGIGGTFLVVSSPFLPDIVRLPLISSGTVAPEVYAQELQARLREVLGPSVRGTVWWTRAGALSASLSGLLFPAVASGRTLTVSVDGGAPQTAVIAIPDTLAAFVEELAGALTSATVTLNADGTLRIGSPTVGGLSTPSSVVIDGTSTLLAAHGGPLLFTSLTESSIAFVHVTANIPFTVMSASTAPQFSYPQINSIIGSAGGGETVGDRTFRAAYSLVDAVLKEDDLLVIDRNTFRIVRVIDDPKDPFAFQRIVVKDALPTTPAGGVTWAIPGWVESTFLDFWGGLVDRGDSVDFEVAIPAGGQHVTGIVSATALGANQALFGRLALNTAELAAHLSLEPGMTVYLARVLRRRFIPIDSRIVDIPILTDVIEITDTDAVLRRNVDYFIEVFRGQNAVRFCTAVGADLGDVWEGERPPPRLWAEYTYVDNRELIEANFGAAIGITRDKVPETVDYLSAVRGIWYALYNGPTLENLRIALQIFLGLPFAEESGIIEEVRTNFLTQQSRILIRDSANTEIVRAYNYPRILTIETNPVTGKPYVTGDAVTQFAPLVTGGEIIDWVKNPTWFQGIVNQGVFYEIQKYHTFMVRVDRAAFNLEYLLAAQAFIKRIKPIYTDPLYVVNVNVGPDEIDVIDHVAYKVTMALYDAPCEGKGAHYYFDEPWPAGAPYARSWRNAFDQNDDPADPTPMYPGPPDFVQWGYDKEWLCPEDHLELTRCETYAGGFPQYDSIFAFDKQLTNQEYATPAVPAAYSATLALFTAAHTGTITRIAIQLNGPTIGPGVDQAHWQALLQLNGSVVATVPFDIGYVHPVLGFVLTMPQNIEIVKDGLAIAITAGQAVSLVISPLTAVTQHPGWTQILTAVSVGQTSWGWDRTFAGGTYCSTGELL